MNHHQNINAIFSMKLFILYLKILKTITKQVKQFKQSKTISIDKFEKECIRLCRKISQFIISGSRKKKHAGQQEGGFLNFLPNTFSSCTEKICSNTFTRSTVVSYNIFTAITLFINITIAKAQAQ